METLLLGLLAGAARYVCTSATRPDLSPEDRLKDAALFGVGSLAGTSTTLALIRAGDRPAAAAAFTAGLGLVGTVGGRGSFLEPVSQGAVWGAGLAGVGSAFRPNWPIGRRPRVFVSHAFRNTAEYLDLRDTLHSSGLSWFDHSVPVYNQFSTSSDRVLHRLLEGQIRGTSAVVLLAAPGVSSRPCVRDEIRMAVAAEKPVLVVEPNGGTVGLPPELAAYPLLERVSLAKGGQLLGGLTKLLSRST